MAGFAGLVAAASLRAEAAEVTDRGETEESAAPEPEAPGATSHSEPEASVPKEKVVSERRTLGAKKSKGLRGLVSRANMARKLGESVEAVNLKADLEALRMEVAKPNSQKSVEMKKSFESILVDVIGNSGVLWERRGTKTQNPEFIEAKAKAETGAECVNCLNEVSACIAGIMERHRYKLQVLYESSEFKKDDGNRKTVLDTLDDLKSLVSARTTQLESLYKKPEPPPPNWAPDDGLPTQMSEDPAEKNEQPVEVGVSNTLKVVNRIKKPAKAAKLEDDVLENLISMTMDKLPVVFQTLVKRLQQLDATKEDLLEEIKELNDHAKVLNAQARKAEEWRLAYEAVAQEHTRHRRRSTLEGFLDVDETFQQEVTRVENDCAFWKQRCADLEVKITKYVSRLQTDVSQALNLSKGFVFPAFLSDRFAEVPHSDDLCASKNLVRSPRAESPPRSLSPRDRVLSHRPSIRPGSAPIRRTRTQEQQKVMKVPSRNVVTMTMKPGHSFAARLELQRRRVLV